MPSMLPVLLAILRSPLATWLVGLVMGCAYTAAILPSGADVARLRATITATAQAAARVSIHALDEQLQHERTLRAAADLAQAQLTDQITHWRDNTEDRRHALQTTATTGADCLRSDALRVLDGAPGLWVSTDTPPAWAPGATAGTAAAHAAAAADPGLGAPGRTASDRQVSAWILTAGLQYEECRARLDALITYVEADDTP